MQLRLATEDDLPGFLRLSAAVQDLHARHEPEYIHPAGVVPGCEEMLRMALGNPAACLVVAETEGAIAGCFYAQELKREESWVRPAQLVFVLEHIAVEASLRRTGIGHALMQRFLYEASRRGIARVELVCWDFNAEAGKFFQAFGFRKVHTRYDRNSLL